MKYYKIEDNKLIEAPINFTTQDNITICNFNINQEKLLEYGYIPLSEQDIQNFNKKQEDNKKENQIKNITSYRFSKLKVKQKLSELRLWNSIKNALTQDQYQDLLLANDFSFDNEIFVKFYNQLKLKIENIDEILIQCI